MSVHADVVARFVAAMGPIDTMGRGAVALRCDHGLAAFREKVLPITSNAGMRVSVAYNPRNWHYLENQSVTPSDLNAWVAKGYVEIWNHSATHGPATRKAELIDEVVGGLTEIQDQLPAARGHVWGWNPPGLEPRNYGGFDGGRTLASWRTPAARFILRHHAVASGMLHGTQLHLLDGIPRVGLARLQMDSGQVDRITMRIDEAAVARKGLQLMIHPAALDRPGKLTSTEFFQVVRHIAKRYRQGLIDVLSPYELTLADSTNIQTTRLVEGRRRFLSRRIRGWW